MVARIPNVDLQHCVPLHIGSLLLESRARSDIVAYRNVNIGVPMKGAYDMVPKFLAACEEPHTLSTIEGTTVLNFKITLARES